MKRGETCYCRLPHAGFACQPLAAKPTLLRPNRWSPRARSWRGSDGAAEAQAETGRYGRTATPQWPPGPVYGAFDRHGRQRVAAACWTSLCASTRSPNDLDTRICLRTDSCSSRPIQGHPCRSRCVLDITTPNLVKRRSTGAEARSMAAYMPWSFSFSRHFGPPPP